MRFRPLDIRKSVTFFFCDDSGLALTGKAAADLPTLKQQRVGAYAATTLTPADIAALTTAWAAAGGFKEIANGYYRFDVDDALFQLLRGAWTITGEASGKHVTIQGGNIIEVDPGSGVLTFSATTGGGLNTVVALARTAEKMDFATHTNLEGRTIIWRDYNLDGSVCANAGSKCKILNHNGGAGGTNTVTVETIVAPVSGDVGDVF